MNLRIQTDNSLTAVEALHQALDQLIEVGTHVKSKFAQKVQEQH